MQRNVEYVGIVPECLLCPISMVDVPAARNARQNGKQVDSEWDSPIQDKHLANLRFRIPRPLRLSIVHRQKPLGSDSRVVEEAESHRVLGLGVVTRGATIGVSLVRGGGGMHSPNDCKAVADLSLCDSPAHLDDSTARQPSADGRLLVDVEGESIEIFDTGREVLDALI